MGRKVAESWPLNLGTLNLCPPITTRPNPHDGSATFRSLQTTPSTVLTAAPTHTNHDGSAGVARRGQQEFEVIAAHFLAS